MAQAQGKKIQINAGFEDSYGEGQASPDMFLINFITESVKAEQSLNRPDIVRGSRFQTKAYAGKRDVKGSLKTPLDMRVIGYLLKAFFGAPSSGGTDPYTHTYKPADTLPSLVVEKAFTDIAKYFLYKGVKLSSLSLSSEGDAPAEIEFGLIGAGESVGASAYDSNVTVFDLDIFTNLQASIKEGGSTLATCMDCSVSIENGFDDSIFPIGSGGKRTALTEGEVVAGGSVSILFEDTVLYEKAMNNTETSLELAFTSGTHSLTITFPEVVFKRNTPTHEGPQGVLARLDFEAFYEDNADASSVKIVLINDVATY